MPAASRESWRTTRGRMEAAAVAVAVAVARGRRQRSFFLWEEKERGSLRGEEEVKGEQLMVMEVGTRNGRQGNALRFEEAKVPRAAI